MPETQRLFFALWPTAALGRELYRLGGDLVQDSGGRRIAAQQIHLTLAFLDSVDAAFRQCAELAADRVSAEPFPLSLDRIGCFPKAGILWIGPQQLPDSLARLVRDLTGQLTGCGYTVEPRPYTAHLTLARQARAKIPERAVEPRVWEIDRFCLARSHTRPHGVHYEVVREWLFRETGSAADP